MDVRSLFVYCPSKSSNINVKKVNGIRTSKYTVYQLTYSEVVEQYRQLIEEKWNRITLTEQDNRENCGRGVKQALIN
jgi:hypothetical protein